MRFRVPGLFTDETRPTPYMGSPRGKIISGPCLCGPDSRGGRQKGVNVPGNQRGPGESARVWVKGKEPQGREPSHSS